MEMLIRAEDSEWTREKGKKGVVVVLGKGLRSLLPLTHVRRRMFCVSSLESPVLYSLVSPCRSYLGKTEPAFDSKGREGCKPTAGKSIVSLSFPAKRHPHTQTPITDATQQIFLSDNAYRIEKKKRLVKKGTGKKKKKGMRIPIPEERMHT